MRITLNGNVLRTHATLGILLCRLCWPLAGSSRGISGPARTRLSRWLHPRQTSWLMGCSGSSVLRAIKLSSTRQLLPKPTAVEPNAIAAARVRSENIFTTRNVLKRCVLLTARPYSSRSSSRTDGRLLKEKSAKAVVLYLR